MSLQAEESRRLGKLFIELGSGSLELTLHVTFKALRSKAEVQKSHAEAHGDIETRRGFFPFGCDIF